MAQMAIDNKIFNKNIFEWAYFILFLMVLVNFKGFKLLESFLQLFKLLWWLQIWQNLLAFFLMLWIRTLFTAINFYVWVFWKFWALTLKISFYWMAVCNNLNSVFSWNNRTAAYSTIFIGPICEVFLIENFLEFLHFLLYLGGTWNFFFLTVMWMFAYFL